MRVTVAICTWNRADLLDQTLVRMRQMRIPEGVTWELLVVNNKCTDHTDSVIANHTQFLPIRRLFESKQGHSNARNCALEAASCDLLLWTDDDVLVSTDWLVNHVQAAHDHPGAAFFGGPIQPWFAEEPRRWIRRHWDRLHTAWAVLLQRESTGPLQEGERIFGANMSFRGDVARRYRYDPNLGRKGKSLVGGDEVDYFERLVDDGFKGVWVGNAPVDHYIPIDRLTSSYVWEYFRCAYRLDFAGFQNDPPRLWGVPRWVVRKYLQAAVRTFGYSLFKGPRFLDALLESAKWRAIMDVCQQSTSASH